MGQSKYIVDLRPDEQAQLEVLVRKGKSSARRQTRARILLKAGAGLPTALHDKPRSGQKPKLRDNSAPI